MMHANERKQFGRKVVGLIIVVMITSAIIPVILLYRGEMSTGLLEIENTSYITPRTFADYYDYELEYTINAPNYQVQSDLSNIMNIQRFRNLYWNQEIEQALRNHYFTAFPNPYTNSEQFSEIYSDNQEGGIPSFVTVDSVLHAYHVIFDIGLKQLEEYNFTEQVLNLMLHQVDRSLDYYNRLSPSRWKDSALKNAAFFSVPAKLIDPSWQIPEQVSRIVETVLVLIENADGFNDNWFMGQREDFSQYIPRGHYTRSDELTRYFKAMMWLGRIGFRIIPADMGLSYQQNVVVMRLHKPY